MDYSQMRLFNPEYYDPGIELRITRPELDKAIEALDRAKMLGTLATNAALLDIEVANFPEAIPKPKL